MIEGKSTSVREKYLMVWGRVSQTYEIGRPLDAREEYLSVREEYLMVWGWCPEGFVWPIRGRHKVD